MPRRRRKQLDAFEELPPERRRPGRAPRRQVGELRAPAGMTVPTLLADYGAIVGRRCKAAARAWLCLSCSQYLANDTQRQFHTETGAHMLARVCPQHGAEAPRREEFGNDEQT